MLQDAPGAPLAAAIAEAEREPCFAPAALGFPLVLLTLLGHGSGTFLVRQGFWLPGPGVDSAWTAAVGIGVISGLLISLLGGSDREWPIRRREPPV